MKDLMQQATDGAYSYADMLDLLNDIDATYTAFAVLTDQAHTLTAQAKRIHDELTTLRQIISEKVQGI